MTQIEAARKEIVTPQMIEVAEDEGLAPYSTTMGASSAAFSRFRRAAMPSRCSTSRARWSSRIGCSAARGAWPVFSGMMQPIGAMIILIANGLARDEAGKYLIAAAA